MTNRSYMQSAENRKVAEGLRAVLADTFVLYFKTHSFHWNVVGRHFAGLHEMFEKQYTELWQATDELAERLRALDFYAPDSFQAMLEHASLEEAGQTPDEQGMIGILARDNRAIVDVIYPVIKDAEAAYDQGTMDMLVGRTKVHEKAAWMLDSMLKH